MSSGYHCRDSLMSHKFLYSVLILTVVLAAVQTFIISGPEPLQAYQQQLHFNFIGNPLVQLLLTVYIYGKIKEARPVAVVIICFCVLMISANYFQLYFMNKFPVLCILVISLVLTAIFLESYKTPK